MGVSGPFTRANGWRLLLRSRLTTHDHHLPAFRQRGLAEISDTPARDVDDAGATSDRTIMPGQFIRYVGERR